MEADRSVVSPPLKDGGLIITGMLIPLIESPPILWVLADRFWLSSAGHGYEACRSNPMQIIGQIECKWLGKSVHLPSG